MAKGSFGLIVANRAVVLGAIKARDLLDPAEQATLGENHRREHERLTSQRDEKIEQARRSS